MALANVDYDEVNTSAYQTQIDSFDGANMVSMKTRILLLMGLFCAVLPGQAIRNNASFYANQLERNDDGSSEPYQLGFRINFFGRVQDTLYVNNNGNVTFDLPLPTYTPQRISETGRVIIAPFWADVDTLGTRSSPVTYGRGVVNGRPAFAANWRNVGYYQRKDDKLNSFQLVLIDRSDTAPGNFDIEFNYETIQWESGEVSGGAGGTGGYAARAGYSNGSTVQAEGNFELPGSGISRSFLDSNANGLIRRRLNSDVPGRIVLEVRSGGVASTLTIEPDALLFTTDRPDNKPALQRINMATNQGTIRYAVTTTTTPLSNPNWLFASPQSGQTPASIVVDVTTESLTPGGYVGAVRIGPAGNANNFGVQEVGVILAVGNNVPLALRAGVVNAASFLPGVLSPGGIFSVFGANLASATVGVNRTPIPDVLGNVRVEINNQRMPLFFVSANQINAMVPHTYQPVQNAVLRVIRDGIPGTPVRVDIAPAVPGVFQQANGAGVVVNQNGTVNNAATPESAGRAIVIYLTGLGPVRNAPNPGVAASETELSPTLQPVGVSIGGRTASVAFAGLSPGFIGLYQINAVVPSGLTAGAHALVVTSADGYPSAPVTFYVN